MRKRAISAVLAASMMLSVVPAPAFAAKNYTGGGNFPDEVTAQTLEQENDAVAPGIYDHAVEGAIRIKLGAGITVKDHSVSSSAFYAFNPSSSAPLTITLSADDIYTAEHDYSWEIRRKYNNFKTYLYYDEYHKKEDFPGFTATYDVKEDGVPLLILSITDSEAALADSNNRYEGSPVYIGYNGKMPEPDPAPTPLELGDDGYPKGTEGGTKNVTASTWKYSTQGKGELTLKSGEFTLNSANVAVNQIFVSDGATLKNSELSGSFNLTVNNGGTIEGGTYNCASIVNQGTINGGSFSTSGDLFNEGGTINGGTFNAGGNLMSTGSINAGIFLKDPGVSATKVSLNADAYTVNGLTLPESSNTIYVVTNNTTEQTVTIQYTGTEEVYSWRASALGNDLGRFYAGYAPITGEELANNAGLTGLYAQALAGIKSISTNKEEKSMTLTATSLPPQLTASLSAVHKPTYRKDDVTIKLGDHEITSTTDPIPYSAGLKNITVTPKDSETAFEEGTDYEVSYSSVSGNTTTPIENFDGKPGTYKMEVKFKETGTHTESLTRDVITYDFEITKGSVPENVSAEYVKSLTVKLPGEDGKVPYDGSEQPATVTNADDTAASVVYQRKGAAIGWDNTAPVEPGTYTVLVKYPADDYYVETYIPVGTITISKGQLTDEQKAALSADKAGNLTSSDSNLIDANIFTKKDDILIRDANGKEYSITNAPAGKYTVSYIYSSDEYEDIEVQIDGFGYCIQPTVENFAEVDPSGITTANAAEKLAELKAALTKDSYISPDDVTITYYQVADDGTETEVAGTPAEVGNYIFKVSVAKSSEMIYDNTPKYNATTDELTSADWAFTITEPQDEPVEPGESGDDSVGTAVAITVGTAAVGGAAYLIGTQVWLETNLPKGAAIPTNRQQLADLLWTAAGKPEPKSSALFTDITATAADSQKAARWCVEQDLLKADGETFNPKAHAFRPQVIKAWSDLQAQLKADK